MRQKPEKKGTPHSRITHANDTAIAGWKDRILSEMEKQDLSQRGLSLKANLGPTSVRHLLTQADTMTLETARRIANALNVPIAYLTAGVLHSVEGGGDAAGRRVRLLQVHLPHEDPAKAPPADRGVVAIPAANLPDKLYAMKITNAAMRVVGTNGDVSPDQIVLPGDVVLWSPQATPEPGSLVVARIGDVLACRQLALTDENKHQLVAWNSAFGRVIAKPSEILGRVLAIQRELAGQ